MYYIITNHIHACKIQKKIIGFINLKAVTTTILEIADEFDQQHNFSVQSSTLAEISSINRVKYKRT